ncbi:MAG: laccase domain-containing protein [Patescibacteria group bacterium]
MVAATARTEPSKVVSSEPTTSCRPFHGVIVEVFGFPTGDWSIEAGGGYQDPNAFVNVARLARDRHRLTGLIVPIVRTFNARLGGLCDFSTMFTPISCLRVRTGLEADGVLYLPPGWGIAFPSADCPTVVIWGQETGIVMAAHAGRDSLFDRAFASGIQNIREETWPIKSIILRMLEWVKSFGEPSESIHVFSCVGIGAESYPHRFDDPRHGRANQRVWEYLKQRYGHNGAFVGENLDLHELIRLQALCVGVPAENITRDRVDTYADTDSSGQPLYHSVRREPGSKKRNLVFVAHLG